MKRYIYMGLGAVVLCSVAGVVMNRAASLESQKSDVVGSGFDSVLDKTAKSAAPSSPEEKVSLSEQVPVMAAPQVSDAVKALTDPKTNYADRLEAMRKLGHEINSTDRAALMEFLASDAPNDGRMRSLAFYSIKNDTLELLLRQRELPDGMGELLTGVVSNPDQNGTWRNYCIQFMAPFYERQSQAEGLGSGGVLQNNLGQNDSLRRGTDAAGRGPMGGPVSGLNRPEDRELEAIREALWAALGERDNSNAGTALLALHTLARNHSEFDRGQIDAAMLELASDEAATVANRISALRLCGESGNTNALATARTLAGSGGTTLLRCAAIATLGEIGEEQDLALIETYAASSDKRIRQIAQTTLAKRSRE